MRDPLRRLVWRWTHRPRLFAFDVVLTAHLRRELELSDDAPTAAEIGARFQKQFQDDLDRAFNTSPVRHSARPYREPFTEVKVQEVRRGSLIFFCAVVICIPVSYKLLKDFGDILEFTHKLGSHILEIGGASAKQALKQQGVDATNGSAFPVSLPHKRWSDNLVPLLTGAAAILALAFALAFLAVLIPGFREVLFPRS